jgi:hypothetical protein
LSGDFVFADSTSNKIKKLSGTTAVLSTIGGPAAGTQTTVGHGGDGGVATSAQMNTPIGVILDSSGNVYFADSGKSSVRMIGTNNISTFGGCLRPWLEVILLPQADSLRRRKRDLLLSGAN